MIGDAVVMAAGLGTRMRPVSERFAKPVLPIDGRPVIVSLLHELAAARIERVTVVTGHLAEQVERLLEGFPLELRFVRQPEPHGSADAVRRAVPTPPTVAVAADTVFEPGAIERFVAKAAGADGAIAVRAASPKPGAARVRVEGGRVLQVLDDDPDNPVAGAPLWFLGEAVVSELDSLSGPPFELAEALQRAVDKGKEIRGIPIGVTRGLTDPLDLVRENFAYLRGLK